MNKNLVKEVRAGKLSTMQLQEILYSNPWITPELIEGMREELRSTNDDKMLSSQLVGASKND